MTLLTGDQAGAVEVLERGLAVAEQAGVEAYLLRCAAPLAAATGSPSVLARAAGLLEQATIPVGGAWLLGEESYLCLARHGSSRAMSNAPVQSCRRCSRWPTGCHGRLR